MSAEKSHCYRLGSPVGVFTALLLATTAYAAPVRQSPIDINPAAATAAPAPAAIKAALATDVTLDVVNTYNPAGKIDREWATLKANVPAGSSIEVGGVKYNLLQFHFHTPSEHAVKGKRTVMEVHFVFLRDGAAPCARNPDALLVIGARIEPGAANPELGKILGAPSLPADSTAPHLTVKGVDLSKVLGLLSGSWRYSGSLTAPASFAPTCLEAEGGVDEQLASKDLPENVSWVLLSHPVTVTPAQVAAFKALFPEGNSREVQPLNRRVVTFVK